MKNPFITNGYAGPEYFCDRVQETSDIISLITNGNNLALISPRRLGKTDLLRHCFSQKEIAEQYYCFIIDIYSTQSLPDFINKLGKSILDELKPKGKKVYNKFINILTSLRAGISYDSSGTPSWSVSLGDITNPNTSLDEIFQYLQNADKPCIVAIDEFQQITKYRDNNVEAVLRTYIQYCNNANFIFSGSHRHLMGTIFTSPNRPFYQSVTIINLKPLDKQKYADFCINNFKSNNKDIDIEVINDLYDRFEGVTFYMQKVMNVLFMKTLQNQKCTTEMLTEAIDYIVNFTENTYEDLLYQLPEKQKQVLFAICAAQKAQKITSGSFVKKYGISSPSSINSAVKGLMDKDLITQNNGVYQVYDKFFDIWLRKQI